MGHNGYMRGVCTVGEIYINTPALSHIGVDEVDKEYDRKYLSYEGEDGGGCGVEYSYSHMALTSYSYMALMDEGKNIYINICIYIDIGRGGGRRGGRTKSYVK
jgi:hypothetical protein